MSNLKDTGWRYYVPEQGEDADDTRSIKVHEWQDIFDHEGAAMFAASGDWYYHDGYEAGAASTYVMVVVSPDGVEKKFNISHEVEVIHYANEVME